MANVTISFSLDSLQDADILRWLEGLPSRGRSVAIRDALRGYLGTRGVTLGDVYQVVKEIDRKLARGVAVASTADEASADEADTPQDILDALDSLGL
jgi:hypothetical protein